MSVNIKIDGVNMTFENEQEPRIIEGRTVVPVSVLLKTLNYSDSWLSRANWELNKAPRGTLTLTNESNVVVIDEESNTFTTNGRKYSYLDSVKAKLVGGRLLVPFRHVLETLGYDVGWDGDTQTVLVTTNPAQYTIRYNANGGSLGVSEIVARAGTVATLPMPTRDGYEFDGWYTALHSGSKVGDAGDFYKVTSSGTLYARWLNDTTDNHTVQTAQTFEIGDVIYGRVESNETSADDYYTITFDGSGMVKFNLDVPESANYTMYLYKDEDGICTLLKSASGLNGESCLIEYSVTAGVKYIVYITANSSTDFSDTGVYELQAVPTLATEIEVFLSKSLIRDNEISAISYEIIPSDAYVKLSIATDNEHLTISGEAVSAAKSCAGKVIVLDEISGMSGHCDVTAAVRLSSKYYISQWYEVWRNTSMGTSTDGTPVTIGDSGCGLCCIAMGLLYENFSDIVSDAEKNDAINQIIDAKFQNATGNMYPGTQSKSVVYDSNTYTVTITPMLDFEDCVNEGYLTMVRIFFPYVNNEGKPAYTSHFVLIDGIDPTYENLGDLRKYLVVDPRDGKSRSLYDAVQNKLTEKNVNSSPNISHIHSSWTRRLTVTKN